MKLVHYIDPIIPEECGVTEQLKNLTPELRNFFQNYESWYNRMCWDTLEIDRTGEE